MLGLMKKDFLLIKANAKSMIVILLVYLMLVMQGTFDASFIIPIMGIMLFISTFSYDEYNNWNAYAITLPNGRKNVVKAKYLATILLTIALEIISLFVVVIISYVKAKSIHIDDVLSSIAGTSFSCILMISLLYPTIFKFGATNGRIAMFAIIFGIAGMVGVLSRFVDLSTVVQMLNAVESYLWIAIPVFSIVLLFLSYLLSDRIYQKKEF